MIFRGTFTVALLCVAGVARAGDKPLYEAAPAWVVAAPAPDYAKLGNNDPAIVLYDQQQRVRDGQVWSFLDQAMRVASAQALGEVGQVKLPWQPDSGDLIVHRAEIIRGNEHIDLIAAGQRFQVLHREEQLEQRQIDGTLTATMAVEGLRVGDVLHLSYSVTSRDKALQGNVQASQGLFVDPVRAVFARASISWPSGSPIKWRSYVDGVAPQVTSVGGFDHIEVKMPLAKLPELPADAPPRYRPLPFVEVSSFADWTAVSKAIAPLYKTEGLIAPGSPLAAEVARIAAKSADPRTRAALALRLVQDEVRYLYNGMDGGNYIPQPAAQTWSLRYGDCKAKTLLLLAILRELGVEAEAVAANSRMGDQLPKRLPSAGAFDHVFVHAIIAGKSLWLDGTGSGARLADLDDTPSFRHVLPLRLEGATLTALPIRAAARPIAEYQLDLDHSAGLSLPATFTAVFTMRGPIGEMIHAGSLQANKEQIEEAAQSMANQLLGDALMSSNAVAYDAESGAATVTVRGVVGTRWRQEDNRYRMTLDKTVSEIDFTPDRARTAWKDIPVATGDVATVHTLIRVRLPADGAGFALEGDQTLPPTLAGTKLTRKAGMADGWVTLDDHIESIGAEIAPAEVAAVRAQVALAKTRILEVVAPADYPGRWKVVGDARRNGGLKQLSAAYAAAIALDPKDANGYRNRASFLAGVWDWKAALADYDTAIGIEPDINLYLSRSRMKLALKDDAGALADAEAALALDPSAASAINQVASLRFRKGDQEGALAMIAQRIAEGGTAKVDFVGFQSELLGEAHRVDEGVAALDAVVKSNPGKPDLLNSRCWFKGTMNIALDTALKDCTRAIEIAEQPAAIYDSRAMVYYRMGRMDDALADLDAALEVAPSQGSSLYLRGVVRKQLGQKGAEDDLAAARMMWPRIDEDYARYGIKP